jgi:hypothetical protein
MEDAFGEELDSARKNKEEQVFDDTLLNVEGYIAGLKRGLEIARTWYDIRIEDGF